MQGAVAVFVKTPGVSQLKTRLAKGVGQERAEEFHRRSCAVLQELLLSARHELSLEPYWAVAEASALHAPIWEKLKCLDQGQGELGDRLSEIYSQLLKQYDFVLLLGADSPQLTLPILLQACQHVSVTHEAFVMGPATDGGYYLFGGNTPLSPEVWNSVPYSQTNTAAAMLKALQGRAEVKMLEELFDVDTVEEWHRLCQLLGAAGDRDWNRAQQELAQWMRDQSIR